MIADECEDGLLNPIKSIMKDYSFISVYRSACCRI